MNKSEFYRKSYFSMLSLKRSDSGRLSEHAKQRALPCKKRDSLVLGRFSYSYFHPNTNTFLHKARVADYWIICPILLFFFSISEKETPKNSESICFLNYSRVIIKKNSTMDD
ncbi:TPA: hypothetical protein ACSJPS_002954 [Listeria monocytogenes]